MAGPASQVVWVNDARSLRFRLNLRGRRRRRIASETPVLIAEAAVNGGRLQTTETSFAPSFSSLGSLRKKAQNASLQGYVHARCKKFAGAGVNLSCDCPVVCSPFLHQVAEDEGEGDGGGGVDSGGLSYRGTLIKKRFDVLRPYVGCAEFNFAPSCACCCC